jgi:hemerythrin
VLGKIDSEHQRLIELINELHAAMAAGQGRPVLEKILNGVAAYTFTHFANEEDLMRKHGYPGYEAHKAEHDKLVAQVRELQADARTSKLGLSLDVMHFLKQWLMKHIAVVDKKYTAHLHAAGVK